VLISVPIFLEGRSPASHPRRFASRFSKRVRIFSVASFLSTAHHQSVVLNSIEDGPHIPMLDDYGVAEPLGIFGEVLFDPGVCVLREGKKQEQRTMILTAEIGSI